MIKQIKIRLKKQVWNTTFDNLKQIISFKVLMKNFKFHFILTFLICFFVKSSFAQDPIYSQFFHSPLVINPAMAGNTNGPLFHLNYRNQWPGINNAYSTYAISYSQHFKKINSGIGILLLTDNAGEGALQSTKAAFVYSYRLKINDKTFIKTGIEAAYGSLGLDWNKFTFGDAIDPRNGPISPGGTPYPSREIAPDQSNISYFDISAGLLLYNELYYIGTSLKHLNTPELTFLQSTRDFGSSNNLPLRFTLHGGLQILLNKGNKNKDDSFLSPNLLYTRQSGLSQLNIGSNINFDKVFGGLWYRNSGANGDAIITMVGVKKDFFKICYSFDYTISDLGITSGGSHEIGMIFNFDSFFPQKTDFNDCLSIFK